MSQPKGASRSIGGKLKLKGNPVSTHTIGPSVSMEDRNPSVADLDHYNIRIISMESHINDHGGHVDLRTSMELRTISTNNKSTGSEAMKRTEEFVKDMSTLNKIKSNKNPGVTDLWGQLETLLALTEERDK